MRHIALLVAVASAAAAPAAQTASAPTVLDSPAHSVPFASAGNAVELELAAPGGESEALGSLTATVASAPAWVHFHAPEVSAAAPEGGAPVARFAFDVDRAAPVGTPAEVVFEVRTADEAALVATHTVRLVASAPAVLDLGTPYPNPTPGAVTVPYAVPEAGPVRLSVFDVLGREVTVLVDGPSEAGGHEVRLDGGRLAPGVYVVRLTSDGEARVRSVTVVR
ncbi:MAG: T9SS type A sorting domain-containing protein [Bacteroidota bacterium]